MEQLQLKHKISRSEDVPKFNEAAGERYLHQSDRDLYDIKSSILRDGQEILFYKELGVEAGTDDLTDWFLSSIYS